MKELIFLHFFSEINYQKEWELNIIFLERGEV